MKSMLEREKQVQATGAYLAALLSFAVLFLLVALLEIH